MKARGTILSCSPAKALIVFAALALLCVSDGIGPRLLPYPSWDSQGLGRAPGSAACASAPGDTSAPSAESGAPVGRADKAVTPIWSGSSRDEIAVSPPRDEPSPDFYAPPVYSFSPASSPQGRAPPRLH
jgi:hypothetical protein